MATQVAGDVHPLVQRTEERRQSASAELDAKQRSKLGQFFTPAPVADFIASLVRLPAGGTVRLLDPGAGAGSLTASVVARCIKERPDLALSLVACEVDPGVHSALRATLEDCVKAGAATGTHVEYELVGGDFIEWATTETTLLGTPLEKFDVVIMNPPYRKLARSSRERQSVEATATETSNLYSAFLALGVTLLAPGGHLAAITPRSFANGAYFRNFRKFFLGNMHLDRLHVFESRRTVFADTDVLQENVIFTAARQVSGDRPAVTVSTSAGYTDPLRERVVAYEEIVHPGDAEFFIHISAEDSDTELAAALAALPASLSETSLEVSTGRVVDFRSKEALRQDPEDGAAPLIYPLHMRDGRVTWPVQGAKKCNAIMLDDSTRKMTFPPGYYVVVKRLSSKEEKRRVVASVYDPACSPDSRIGFENHVNVFHEGGDGLASELAHGLCLWLNSTLLDQLVRRFNGHTQINVTDLRNLRYPNREQLVALGREWNSGPLPDQEMIDKLVEKHVRNPVIGAQ
ncbi:Eco57I restriction-modification methylase domain-containing protein [Kitasatospora sp. NPDC094015]|uniref:Eco57I restriction-modification methylase domain-containing protein n=1 Tax=Kitasatospora sp. NPDC094015 TaxID=3155205 RepID=UPI003324D112